MRVARGHHAPRPRDGPADAGIPVDPPAARCRTARDRLFFAHSDLSGLPLFEEAQYRGVAAADAALEVLGRA